jgi:2-haloalkanoic acid dehalogenase type II
MRLHDFTVLTFDCYGTLIDWEAGITAALQPWLQAHDLALASDAILEAFAHHEAAQQAETPSMRYAELLAVVYKRLGRHWNIPATDADATAFGQSIRLWPAFADTVQALRYLAQHYTLVILSNVDRASFAASNRILEVTFDAIYTAEDIGSYKPDPRNFAYMLAQLAARGIDKAHILHTAQSLFHDHVPATAAGLATCWIDRRHAQGGYGATMPPTAAARIDFRFPSLAALVAAHQGELDTP